MSTIAWLRHLWGSKDAWDGAVLAWAWMSLVVIPLRDRYWLDR